MDLFTLIGIYLHPDLTRTLSNFMKGSIYMYDLHEYIANELCNNKSLGALTYLLEKGREFEFSYKGTLCFISRSKTQKEVSIWVDKQEYAFDNIDDLAESKIFDDKTLLDIWNEIEVETLF